jgi:hypothetical protein
MGPNHSKKLTDQSIENVVEFIYLGMNLKNQNCRKRVTKSILNWEKTCYH